MQGNTQSEHEVFPLLGVVQEKELEITLSRILAELQFLKNEVKTLQKKLNSVLQDDLK